MCFFEEFHNYTINFIQFHAWKEACNYCMESWDPIHGIARGVGFGYQFV